MFWVNNKKDTFQELEILMNQLTICKEKVDIQSTKLNLVESEVTFVMEDIIPCIGWDSV